MILEVRKYPKDTINKKKDSPIKYLAHINTRYLKIFYFSQNSQLQEKDTKKCQ